LRLQDRLVLFVRQKNKEKILHSKFTLIKALIIRRAGFFSSDLAWKKKIVLA